MKAIGPGFAYYIVCVVYITLFSGAVFAADGGGDAMWHAELALSGGDVWRARIPVDFFNRKDQDYAGFPVGLKVGRGPGEVDLVGAPAQSIRVSDSGGTEMLFDLRAPDGRRLAGGAIPAGAVLTVPVTVKGGSSQRLYVYFDNPSAHKLPDFLNGSAVPTTTDTFEIRIGAVERLEIASGPDETSFLTDSGKSWDIRIPVAVVNPSAKAVETLVQTPLGRLKLLYLRGFNPRSLRIVDPETGQVMPARIAGDNLLFLADIPARSLKRFYIYLSRDEEIGEGPQLDYADLVAHPANLAANPSFELGNDVPDGWNKGSPGILERLPGGIVGEHFARTTVPASVTPNWTGWRQSVTVEPGADYLFLAFVRTINVTGGSVRIHAHILEQADGGIVRRFWSAGPDLTGTTDWELLGGVIRVLPRASTVELHLTMNAHGTLDHDGVVMMRTAQGHQGAIELNPAAAPDTLAVWTENPIVKVFQDTPPDVNDPAASGIRLYAARGEKEVLQLVLRSAEAVQVKVTIDALRFGDAQLPAPEVAVVGYVPVLQPSGYHSASISRNAWERLVTGGGERTDGWQGWWPDYLLPTDDGTVELTPQRTQPLWITFTVPKDAVPGLYTGTLRIAIDGATVKKIPVSLRVWRFALPDRPSLQAIYDLRSGPGWSTAQSKEEREQWWRFMSERRVSADQILPAPEFRLVDGRVVMDTSEFDEAAALYFDELQMAAAYFPRIFYAAGWAHPPRAFLNRPYGTREYREAYRQAVALFWNHVKAKGWADRMVLYLSDEPHYQRPEVVERLGEIIQIIREVDPQIPVYSSTWGFVPQWEGLLNHWGIAQDGRFPFDVLERRLRAGDKVWFTTDGQMELNTPYNAVERLLPYYAFTYGVHGYEFWGISWYTYNPFEFGWHSYIRQSDTPGEEYWVRYPHGDGYLAYPGALVGRDGPISTIRLEQAREGLEDYEIYAALQRLAEIQPDLEARIKPVLDEVRRLGALPNAGGYRSTRLLPDPDALLEVRRRAGELLDELMAGAAGAPVSGRVVDPLGRALEGIRITVRGGGVGQVESGADGGWSVESVRGYAVVTPRKAGWSFSPNEIVVPAGTADVRIVATPPAPKVRFAGLRDRETVVGEIRPTVRVEWPEPPAKGELVAVTLRFAGEAIYQGSSLPEELSLDTRRYPDGRYTLDVEVTTDYGATAAAAISLQVDNWWEIDDPFRPPLVTDFFGTLDFRRTSAQSAGWTYATERPADFGGDGDRIVRQADTAEYLIWETPHLTEFEVTVYATRSDLTNVVVLAVSADGEAWREVAYAAQVEPLSAPGWFVHRLAGAIPDDQEAAHFRLAIPAGVVPAAELQIGRVKLVGRREAP